jgi:A/G-specific adenine glycosylase
VAIIHSTQFQKLILQWFDLHGRKHFPWQKNKTPYRVWVSEIMLQQTQVNTVIPYYENFMHEFPDIKSLARAREDKVLHLWAGLGYYSRARNLHRAAKMVMEEFGGKFPDNLEDLQALPGVGRSTAGAIFSIAYNQQAAILDGNVKRVLARFQGITEPINNKNIEALLWQHAERYTPKQRAADYTQAMMDLGATICVRSRPQCMQCPLIKYCAAHQENLTHLIPAKKAGRELPVRTATFLVLQKDERILLRKRPPMGIWGGLFSFPEISGEPLKENIQAYCRQKLNIPVTKYQPLKSFRHTFSHYHLDIHPVIIPVKRMPTRIMEDGQQIWYNPHEPESVGLPKPVQLIMRALR